MSVIGSVLLKKMLDESLRIVQKAHRRRGKTIAAKFGDFETAIDKHSKRIAQWSSYINFDDLNSPKKINDLYIELEYFNYPKRLHHNKETKKQKSDIYDLLQKTDYHIVIYGQPGSGKTTTVKMLTQKLLTEDNFMPDITFPIVIKLRDLNGFNSEGMEATFGIMKFIYKEMGFLIQDRRKVGGGFEEIEITNFIDPTNQKIITEFIDNLSVLIVLDGFDELNNVTKKLVIQELKILNNSLHTSRVILTSRTGSLQERIKPSIACEICHLDENRIRQFTLNWFKSEDKSNKFLKDFAKSPLKETFSKPLSLAHLCALYQRNFELPDKPKHLFEKIIKLLIENWDKQRGFVRVSEFSSMSTEMKFDYFCNLAFYLTTIENTYIFSKEAITQAYKSLCTKFRLPAGESEKFYDEIESHTGIFIRSSYFEYEFVHRSFQDYLTANYISTLPELPNEYDVFSSPYQMAMAISLSSSSSQYFANFILKHLCSKPYNNQYIHDLYKNLEAIQASFEPDSDLGLAMLCLYSKAVYSDNKFRRRSSIDNFMAYKVFKSSVKKLMNNYDRVKKIYSSNLPNLGKILNINDRNITKLIFEFDPQTEIIGYKSEILSGTTEVFFNEYTVIPPEYLICKPFWIR